VEPDLYLAKDLSFGIGIADSQLEFSDLVDPSSKGLQKVIEVVTRRDC
jgi:hypothetical protein